MKTITEASDNQNSELRLSIPKDTSKTTPGPKAPGTLQKRDRKYVRSRRRRRRAEKFCLLDLTHPFRHNLIIRLPELGLSKTGSIRSHSCTGEGLRGYSPPYWTVGYWWILGKVCLYHQSCTQRWGHQAPVGSSKLLVTQMALVKLNGSTKTKQKVVNVDKTDS